MRTSTLATRLRRLAALGAVALAFGVVPVATLAAVHPAPAAASSITNSTGASGDAGPVGPSCGTHCYDGVAYCHDGAGYIPGGLLFLAPYPLCWDPHAQPYSVSQTCVTAYDVWRFYGTGNPNSGSERVDAYSVSALPLQQFCDPAQNRATFFAPDPTDTGTSASMRYYQQTPGDAWCQGGVARSLSMNGPKHVSCVGFSPSTGEDIHFDPNGQPTTDPPIAVATPGGRSCAALQTSPNPVAPLLSDSTLVDNPWLPGQKITIAQAVREALVGSPAQLGGKRSTYGYWAGLADVTARMAAAVVDATAATSPTSPLPSVGNPGSLSFNDHVACSSDLQYVATSKAKEVNYGLCEVPVAQLLTKMGDGSLTLWARDAYAETGYRSGTYVPAGARFFAGAGNTRQSPVPAWRRIIYDNVASGHVGFTAVAFPYQPYTNNGDYAVAPDQALAARAASSGATCYWGEAGTVLHNSSLGGSVASSGLVLPPADAIVQITINPNPAYATTGGTYHPVTFTSSASALLCPVGQQYVPCAQAYPGEYALDALNWHLTLTSSDPSTYRQCTYQQETGCQYYVTSDSGGSLTAVFYQATPPGVTLHLNAGGISGSYTISASGHPSSYAVGGGNGIVLCGDGVFANRETGLAVLDCTHGGVYLGTGARTSSLVRHPASAGAILTGAAIYCNHGQICIQPPPPPTGGGPGSGSGSGGGVPTTTTTLPAPETIPLGPGNVQVLGARDIIVLGASSSPAG